MSTEYKRLKVRNLLLSVLVFILVFSAGWYTVSQYDSLRKQEQQFSLKKELSAKANSISQIINNRFALLYGVRAFVTSHFDSFGGMQESLSHDTINRFLKGIYETVPDIHSVVISPDGIHQYIYPVTDATKKTLGHNLLTDKRPHVRKKIQKTIESKAIGLSGPYALRENGNLSLIARLPIYQDGKFWGFAAMVYNVPIMLTAGGIELDGALAFRIVGGKIFYGDPDIFKETSLVSQILLPDGQWEIATSSTTSGLTTGSKVILFTLAGLVALMLSILFFLFITKHWYLQHNIEKATKVTIKLERDLFQAQKMESIGNLAGGIAHDFNNILSSILGFSELALDEVKKGTVMDDNLQEIYAGGLRAKEIVNQILAFARQSDEGRKPIRVDTILREVLKLIHSTTPTTIETRKEIDSSSLVMGKTTEIHQITMNLCTNAVHAMQDNGGVMEVALKDVLFEGDVTVPEGLNEGKYIELTISDTGCGIEPAIADSIFDPYFTTKGIGEGTGMGLAMVRGIVDSYGGSIKVDSKPSSKTVFTIYLPVTTNLENEITHETATLPKGDEHILFVDDEPPIARMGSRILENLGYQVTTRTSSIEALKLFKAKPDAFQLVITDMTMPHMTGDQFAIELKRNRTDIPIILCTGYSNKINAEMAQEIGINAFTYKPFTKADLASTVREVLDKT